MSLLRRWAERTIAGLAIATACGPWALAAAPAKKTSPAAFAILTQPEAEAPGAPQIERQPSSAPPAPGETGPSTTGPEDSFAGEMWRDETGHGEPWHDESWDGYMPNIWSHWTINLDAVFWRRSTPDALQLAASDTANPDMAPNASQLTFDHEAGPRLALIRRGISGWDVEINFLGIEGWTSRIDAPGATDVRLPGDEPGGLFSSDVLGFPLNQLFVHYQSHLFSEELNLRRQLNETWTGILGFRALQIYERFDVNQGAFTDAFLTIETENRLYGVQIGGEGRLFDWGPASLATTLKIGLFENNSEQSTADVSGTVSGGSTLPARITASTNQASLVAEIGLLGSYQLAESVFLRAGYHVMWVDDVSLAPEQYVVNGFQTFPPPPITEMEGITAKDSLIYHGAVVGLELTW